MHFIWSVHDWVVEPELAPGLERDHGRFSPTSRRVLPRAVPGLDCDLRYVLQPGYSFGRYLGDPGSPMAIQELTVMAGCLYAIVKLMMIPVKLILVRVRRSLA